MSLHDELESLARFFGSIGESKVYPGKVASDIRAILARHPEAPEAMRYLADGSNEREVKEWLIREHFAYDIERYDPDRTLTGYTGVTKYTDMFSIPRGSWVVIPDRQRGTEVIVLHVQAPVGDSPEVRENGVSDGEREEVRTIVYRALMDHQSGMGIPTKSLHETITDNLRAAGYRKPTLPSVEDVAKVVLEAWCWDGDSEQHAPEVRVATAVLDLLKRGA